MCYKWHDEVAEIERRVVSLLVDLQCFVALR